MYSWLTFSVQICNFSTQILMYVENKHRHIAMIIYRQTVPLLNGRVLFSKISLASVPLSIKSSLVITPIVRNPVIKVTTVIHIPNYIPVIKVWSKWFIRSISLFNNKCWKCIISYIQVYKCTKTKTQSKQMKGPFWRWSKNKTLGMCVPWGSTSFAIFKASEFARSVLAGETARIRQLSLVINSRSMALICISISWGWSPIATRVIPGRSIRVKFNTENLCKTFYFNNSQNFKFIFIKQNSNP